MLASLLLWLACAAASIRAHWWSDVFICDIPFALMPKGVDRSRETALRVRNQVHAISIEWFARNAPLRRRPLFAIVPQWADRAINDPNATLSVPGFRLFNDRVFIAHWLISSLTFPLPALALLRWRRRVGRVGHGLCPTCGYDLRASPDRCPECGNGVIAPPGRSAPASAV